jgi:hypothetical protein
MNASHKTDRSSTPSSVVSDRGEPAPAADKALVDDLQ